MRVLLDSSVLISSFLLPANPAGVLVRAGFDGKFELCASMEILEEIERSLRNKLRLRERYRYVDDEIARFIGNLHAFATVVRELPAIPRVCRDPSDDHVLAAALAANADYIVTGDADPLELRSYQGIPVRAFAKNLSLRRLL